MRSILPLMLLLITACNSRQKAELLVYNGVIYTVDSAFSRVEAMVVSGGRIIATGNLKEMESKYDCRDKLDVQGKFVYPGFIDAHAHFAGYALSLQRVDLTGTGSWQEVLERTQAFAKQNPSGWILGRGWDQNDWKEKDFPDNSMLNQLWPDRPVLLSRVDGHAAIANNRALEEARIAGPMEISGGELLTKNGKPTGVLIDNAVDLVASRIPPPGDAAIAAGMKKAEQNCFAAGLTTIDDCGLDYKDAERIMQLQQEGHLQMRLYVMLSDAPANFDYLAKKGIIKTDRMHIRGFKVYADGALGSRGACLLRPYSDMPHHSGFLLSSPAHFDSVATWIAEHDFQMCTHAIGDSGNRTMLTIYAAHLKGKNDRRWRIEHAQVVDENDLPRFGAFSIIPSVQPTHATSDMYWAEKRLGPARIRTAYAYQQLLRQNGWLPLGTDFPVEDISPFKTFYAAVERKDAAGWPANGFQTENALTREQALRGMTIWAAASNFEEKEKGSLEAGKFADFVILDRDIMKVKTNELLTVSALATFVNGVKVYQKK